MAKRPPKRQAARKRAHTTRPSLTPTVGIWNPPGLTEYLRELQAQYRPTDIPFPRTPTELADEARRDIFNANHLVHVLVGHRGPWAEEDLPRWNLPLTLGQYDQLAARIRERGAPRRRMAKHNARFQSAMNWITTLPFWSEEDRQQVLNILGRQKVNLDDYVFHPMRRLGVTRRPDTPLAGQGFWTPFVVQLYAYLKRTTPCEPGGQRFSEIVTRREPQPAQVLFEMIARILHLASQGRFPDDPARVKKRWYSALRAEQPREVLLTRGGQRWTHGQRARTPEGLIVPVLGVAWDCLVQGLLVFIAAVRTRDAVLIQPAARIFTDATPSIRVDLSGATGLYPPERLQPLR